MIASVCANHADKDLGGKKGLPLIDPWICTEMKKKTRLPCEISCNMLDADDSSSDSMGSKDVAISEDTFHESMIGEGVSVGEGGRG